MNNSFTETLLKKYIVPVSAIAGIVACVSTQAIASELTVNNCDGTLLSSSEVDEGSSAKVVIITDQGKASTVTLKRSGGDTVTPATTDVSLANFSDVHEGIWSACTSDSKTVLSAEIKKESPTGTLALLGAGAAGIGSIVALSTSGGGGGSDASDVVASTSTTSGASTTAPAASSGSPVREVTSPKPVEVVSTNADCTGIKTLAASSGCRNTEDTDPLSPYK